jgi:predicted phosphodiesterase
MKIWHISDTHNYHILLTIPEGIDTVIFSGDCSNPRDPYNNEPEVRDFLRWFSLLPIKNKIFVAGNHDTSIEKGLINKIDFNWCNVIYLFNEEVVIDGIKFWGSPHTPNFGNWAFMKDRGKISRVWDSIPEDVEVIITHGPPQGVLDISEDRLHNIELCGDSALRKRIRKLQKVKLICFGHIHNNKENINAGTLKWSDYDYIFSNGSVVTDGRFGKLSSNGNILEI